MCLGSPGGYVKINCDASFDITTIVTFAAAIIHGKKGLAVGLGGTSAGIAKTLVLRLGSLIAPSRRLS
ncbi:hypothetical protein V6N12_050820 [Hibiscus sabdariffa]|uniref:Uncharacterized protein n=1 Tax=Hibiscus sabdariffa TaxID=183260 RepID=A0ABR2GE51_9ROSI